MNSLFERPLLVLAVVLASALVALGLRGVAVRRLARRRGGAGGLFWGTVALFLLAGSAQGMAGELAEKKPCSGKADAAQDVVRLADGTLLPAELAAEGRWAMLKALWKKLDKAGRDAQFGDSPMNIAIGGTATSEQLKSFHDELAKAVGCTPDSLYRMDDLRGPGTAAKAPGERCAVSLPTRVLVEVALARIWALGPDTTMMLHMMPPPEMLHHNRLRTAVQRRFELLVTALRENKLTGPELKSVLAGLEAQVHHYAVYKLAKGLGELPHEAFGDIDLGWQGTGAMHGEEKTELLVKEAEGWLAHAEQWCKENGEGTGKGESKARQERAAEVAQACASMRSLFEELERERPRIKSMLNQLNGTSAPTGK